LQVGRDALAGLPRVASETLDKDGCLHVFISTTHAGGNEIS
jgi:hypothetical protein